MKMFEVRDRGTFIPVMAILIDTTYPNSTTEELWLLRRAGFSLSCWGMIYLIHIIGKKASYDSNDWGNRTMSVAHYFIERNWDNLETGEVIDVQFILGETFTKKISERLDQNNDHN